MAVDEDARLADDAAGRLLDAYCKGLVNAQYSRFRSVFRMPCLVDVAGAVQIIKDEDGLRKHYGAARSFCAGHDLKDVVSTIVSVDRLTPTRLGVTGVICFMKPDATRFDAPFPIYFLVDQTDDAWRVSCVLLAIVGSDDLKLAFQSRP